MPRPFKTCRHCGQTSTSAEYREGYYVVLCAECHLDLGRKVSAEFDSRPDTRVVFPAERPYQGRKGGLQMGGSR